MKRFTDLVEKVALITSRIVLFTWLVLCGALWHAPAADALVLTPLSRIAPIGRDVAYLVERDGPLTLAQAQARQKSGDFKISNVDILSFGLGSAPVWIYVPVENPSDEAALRRLSIENSWLDTIDIYFVAPDGAVTHERLGDSLPFGMRPVQSRFFAEDWNFALGLTQVYIRIESVDPMLLPIFLLDAEQAHTRERIQDYHYGFLYGYIAALLIYNLVLFVSLRDRRHLHYALFLAAFQLMNIAYTGHGFFVLWPQAVTLQRWVIPVLMVSTAVCGLAFAKNFLETARYSPRVHRLLGWFSALALLSVLLAEITQSNQLAALYIAFVVITVFSVAMLLLGIDATRRGQRYAPYFLYASIASALGTALTALTVWGILPFAEWAYHAVEYGMVCDATLLALALGKYFRQMQRESLIAVQHAARDPLTDLHNRRAFLEMAQSLWEIAERDNRPLSLVIIDLDHFKAINDTYGHGTGDSALIAVAKVLTREIRNGDIIARWGGEEFLLLLPETEKQAAVVLAERLRSAVADIRVAVGDAEIALTASSGVASKTRQSSLNELITEADDLLYRAKREGRNRVCYSAQKYA